jgi:hypothetical protein
LPTRKERSIEDALLPGHREIKQGCKMQHFPIAGALLKTPAMKGIKGQIAANKRTRDNARDLGVKGDPGRKRGEVNLGLGV